MSSINVPKTIFESQFAGLSNIKSNQYTFNVPSVSLPLNGSQNFTFSIPLPSSSGIPSMRINLSNFSSEWYQLDGGLWTYTPGSPAATGYAFSSYTQGNSYVIVVTVIYPSGGSTLPLTLVVRPTFFTIPF